MQDNTLYSQNVTPQPLLVTAYKLYLAPVRNLLETLFSGRAALRVFCSNGLVCIVCVCVCAHVSMSVHVCLFVCVVVHIHSTSNIIKHQRGGTFTKYAMVSVQGK
jgi:hypothetical protein